MIEIRDLTKQYDGTLALRGISVEIPAGELFGFLGPNGAGKTTTLQILAGLIAPTSGTAKVAGFDVQTEGLEAKRHLGYVPDRPFIYDKLTARELVALYGDLFGVDRSVARREGERWLDLFGLADRRDDLIEGFSHGMKQRVTLAATLLPDPDVLVTDEPTVGLDPQGAKLLKDVMRARCAAGKTVLMSTHTLQVADETCDRVGVLHHGAFVGLGTVPELRELFSRDGASLEEIFLDMTADRDVER